MIVIAGTPQEAMHAGSDNRQPLVGLFLFKQQSCLMD